MLIKLEAVLTAHTYMPGKITNIERVTVARVKKMQMQVLQFHSAWQQQCLE